MSEAVIACKSAGGFIEPTIAAVRGTASGQAMSFTGFSLVDDFLFHWQSVPTLIIPTPLAGYTAFGAGISCDASGNDTAVLLSVKKVTANDEDIPAVSGGSRGIGVLVRNLASNYTSILAQAYNATIAAGLAFSSLTPTRNVPYLAFSKLMGTGSVSLNALGMTELHVQNAASSEVRAASHPAAASFAGGTIGVTPVSTQARATVVVPLYGKAA